MSICRLALSFFFLCGFVTCGSYPSSSTSDIHALRAGCATQTEIYVPGQAPSLFTNDGSNLEIYGGIEYEKAGIVLFGMPREDQQLPVIYISGSAAEATVPPFVTSAIQRHAAVPVASMKSSSISPGGAVLTDEERSLETIPEDAELVFPKSFVKPFRVRQVKSARFGKVKPNRALIPAGQSKSCVTSMLQRSVTKDLFDACYARISQMNPAPYLPVSVVKWISIAYKSACDVAELPMAFVANTAGFLTPRQLNFLKRQEALLGAQVKAAWVLFQREELEDEVDNFFGEFLEAFYSMPDFSYKVANDVSLQVDMKAYNELYRAIIEALSEIISLPVTLEFMNEVRELLATQKSLGKRATFRDDVLMHQFKTLELASTFIETFQEAVDYVGPQTGEILNGAIKTIPSSWRLALPHIIPENLTNAKQRKLGALLQYLGFIEHEHEMSSEWRGAFDPKLPHTTKIHRRPMY